MMLEARGISKRFGGVQALADVSIHLHPSEVLAVVGENGAGKSTLMKILAGVIPPDQGQILLEGSPVRLDSPRAATQHGIALIHQELSLCDNLSVAENIFLGYEPRSRLGFVNRTKMVRDARGVLDKLGLPSTQVSASMPVHWLSIGHQQMVEIARALASHARILIMDEPTSSLSQHETDRLLALIRELKSQGVSIIYISHRLREVQQIADRVCVLRDGKNAGELQKQEISHDRMVQLMVGRSLTVESNPESHAPHPILSLLTVHALRTSFAPDETVELELYPGEIMGLAGLVGAGRTELARALFGIEPVLGGEIRLNDRSLKLRSPRDAIRAGIALVPEDRKQQGLILEMAIQENIALAGLSGWARVGFVRWQVVRRIANEMRERLQIRASSLDLPAESLSGGNQQKVVLAKWLSLQPRVLILDEPTRGVDVGAKEEIYRVMRTLAESGVAILMISSEMQEVLRVPDRVLVMHQGRVMGELHGESLTEENVMQMATGNLREWGA
jgi:ribose transport system ATP-binding protein